jgi:hypothetical protein
MRGGHPDRTICKWWVRSGCRRGGTSCHAHDGPSLGGGADYKKIIMRALRRAGSRAAPGGSNMSGTCAAAFDLAAWTYAPATRAGARPQAAPPFLEIGRAILFKEKDAAIPELVPASRSDMDQVRHALDGPGQSGTEREHEVRFRSCPLPCATMPSLTIDPRPHRRSRRCGRGSFGASFGIAAIARRRHRGGRTA